MEKSTKAYRRPIVCLNYGSKKDCVRFIAFRDAKEWVNLNPNLYHSDNLKIVSLHTIKY